MYVIQKGLPLRLITCAMEKEVNGRFDTVRRTTQIVLSQMTKANYKTRKSLYRV